MKITVQVPIVQNVSKGTVGFIITRDSYFNLERNIIQKVAFRGY